MPVRFRLLALLPLLALPLQAQVPESVRSAVAASQPTQYEQPECGIKAGHFRVSGAATYLKTAIGNEANRERLLKQAEDAIKQAIAENDQGKNPGAWYYLGRVYLYQGDVVGADTAFTHAAALAPECADEIRGFRESAWRALAGIAGTMYQNQQTDSALMVYRLAASVDPSEPQTHYLIGTIFETTGKPDSALVYYRKAVEVARDPSDRYASLALRQLAGIYSARGDADSAIAYYDKMIAAATAANDTTSRNAAALSRAIALQNAKQYPQAIAGFRQYLAWRPEDANAKRYLAAAFQGNNQPDSAEALLRELGLSSGTRGPDTSSAEYLVNRGANYYQAKEFQKAAGSFARAAEVDTLNHIALRNLALTYNTLKDGAKLLDAATRLVALEPLSETAQRLQIQGYIDIKDKVHGAPAVDRLDAMPVDLDVSTFVPNAGGAHVAGKALGRAPKRNGKALAPAPVTVTFQFVDGSGKVVATHDLEIPALSPGKSWDFNFEAEGSNLSGWVYHRK